MQMGLQCSRYEALLEASLSREREHRRVRKYFVQDTKWKEAGALQDLIRRVCLGLLEDLGPESEYPADLQRKTTETFFLQRLALGLIFKYIILLGRQMGAPAGGLFRNGEWNQSPCSNLNELSASIVRPEPAAAGHLLDILWRWHKIQMCSQRSAFALTA